VRRDLQAAMALEASHLNSSKRPDGKGGLRGCAWLLWHSPCRRRNGL